MDELVYVVAAPFKRSGATSISVRDFDFSLSFDLKWISPQQATALRDLAVGSGLLREENKMLFPTFDTSVISIPRDFRPSGDLLKKTLLIDKILQYISVCSNLELREIVAKVNQYQEQLSEMVDLEVAAFLVGKELGCNMDVFYEQVQQKVSNG